MNRGVFTPPEADWLSRNILKSLTLLEVMAEKDPQTRDRKTYKVLKTLEEKMEEVKVTVAQLGQDGYEVELLLSTKQKQLLKELVDKSVNSLETVIIPEYVRRGLEDYVAKSRDKIQKLKVLSRKLK